MLNSNLDNLNDCYTEGITINNEGNLKFIKNELIVEVENLLNCYFELVKVLYKLYFIVKDSLNNRKNKKLEGELNNEDINNNLNLQIELKLFPFGINAFFILFLIEAIDLVVLRSRYALKY